MLSRPDPRRSDRCLRRRLLLDKLRDVELSQRGFGLKLSKGRLDAHQDSIAASRVSRLFSIDVPVVSTMALARS